MKRSDARFAPICAVSAVAGAIALASAGCGGHGKSAADSQKASAFIKTCDPADDSCIPSGKPSAIFVPALGSGKAMAIRVPTSHGTASLEITLKGLKTHPRTSEDPKNTEELCFGFTMKNTGTRGYEPDDLVAGMNWKWFGLDGERNDPDAGAVGICSDLGHQFSGVDQPAPLPGRYVTGYYSLTVPTKPGVVEVTDSGETPLFRLNYGPQSAQVQIDARG